MTEPAETNWQAEMRTKAEKAAHDLLGTCKSIHDLGEDFEAAQEDFTFCAVLDSLVFCCTSCDWWCEIGECNDNPGTGEWVCNDCMPEEGE